VPESLKIVKELEELEEVEVIRHEMPLALDAVERDLGVRFTDDVSSLYRLMQKRRCLARVETFSRVLAALEGVEDIHIGAAETHYANAVVPDPDGLALAYAEGRAPGSVRAVIAFGKTIVGFKTDHLSVTTVDFGEEDGRNLAERARLCRHVEGDVGREDIQAVVLRIPRASFPEARMTEEEARSTSPFIFRGFQMTNAEAGEE
jgi:hypothetical protein